MKPFLESIKNRVLQNKPISENQFLSIVKFIERESEFRDLDRDSIVSYFSPLIVGYLATEDEPSTLESFLI